jgi:hypothetical protein
LQRGILIMADTLNGGTSAQLKNQDSIEAASRLFGEHPAAVFAIIKNAAVVMENLEVIFGAFRDQMEKSGDCRRRHIAVADAGFILAGDASSYLACWSDDLQEALLKAGVELRESTTLAGGK